ncbi:MAG: glutathione S-transferase family protein [Pseudomonadota bacterium]
MKLYHAPKAVNPERVVHFLRAKGRIDAVEIEEISIMDQEHKTDAYRALSPFSQVPVLVSDDGTTMTESRAICTYIEGLYPDPNLMGGDAKERALVEMWDRRIEFMFMMQFALWFRNAHPMMAPLETPQCEGTAQKAEKNARAFAKRLDEHLKDHAFVAADRFTIADITAYLTCGFCGAMRWQPHKELEHLSGWYARLKAMPFTGR